MSVYRYPQEVHDFVRENCTRMRDDDLAEACNRALGTQFTKEKMRTFRGNHGYKNGMSNKLSSEEWRTKHSRFPPGMYEFIRDHGHHVGSQEMADMIREKFDFEITAKEVKSYRARYKLSSGLTGWWREGHEPANKGKKIAEYMTPEAIEKLRKTTWKKGHRPVNEKQIGEVVKSKANSGYLVRKKSMTGSMWERWELLHRAVWEEHNGPIPDGYCVVFRDGNKQNCDISNLTLMKRDELATMNKRKMFSECPEVTDARLTLVRIEKREKEITRTKRRLS